MKRAFVSVLLCGCAAVTTTGPDASPGEAPACTQPPEVLYGATLLKCEEDADSGDYCCGYRHVVELGEVVHNCGYLLCRASCEEEFLIAVGLCQPRSVFEQKQKEIERQKEHDNGVESL